MFQLHHIECLLESMFEGQVALVDGFLEVGEDSQGCGEGYCRRDKVEQTGQPPQTSESLIIEHFDLPEHCERRLGRPETARVALRVIASEKPS